MFLKFKGLFNNSLKEKNKSDDFWCVQLDFVSNWLHWIILSLTLISISKLMANGALMFGIIERNPSPIKCWLIIEGFEIFLIFWAFCFEFFIFIYMSGMRNASITVLIRTKLSLMMASFFLFIIIKSCLWRLVSSVHGNLKKERKDGKAWNKYFAYALHHNHIQIEKANGEYMRF